ncbi:uncharacterized protein [Rhodnius prolixus]|uniref:uncharacterized protein n=1 Tax=Rhodnius prolixus TaxID=13249 RepID=UPI003D18D000
MKLLLIYAVFSYSVLIQDFFVGARPRENIKADTGANTKPTKLGNKANQLAKEILRLIEIVPELEFISDYGESRMKNDEAPGTELLQFIKTLKDKKFHIIGNLVKTGHEVVTNVTKTGIGMVQNVATAGNSVFHTSIESAQDLAGQLKNEIDNLILTADRFSKFLRRIKVLLEEVRKILLAQPNN